MRLHAQAAVVEIPARHQRGAKRGSADKETAMAAPGGGSGADGKGPTENVPSKAPPEFTAHAFVFGDLNTPGAFVRPKRRHRKGDPADCVAACCAPPTAPRSCWAPAPARR